MKGSDWMPVILAVLSLAREIFGYLSELEKDKKTRTKKILGIRDGFKEARNSGNTASLERAFRDVGIDLRAKSSKV